MKIHPDYYDFVKALNDCKVDYVIRHKDLADLELLGEKI